MKLTLDTWQKEALEHRGDLILCTGRQIGKTTIMARKAADRMLEQETHIIIVSLSEDQAKLIISMILSYLETNHRKELAKKSKNKPQPITQNRVTTKNGSFALARPVGNTGDAIRGFTGDILIIDEASRMPEMAFTAAEPTLLSTGGEVWMCSTPHGKQGYFWEQYNAATQEEETEIENEMGWKVMHVNGEEAIKSRPISESWKEKQKDKAIRRLEKLRERWSDLRYGQEILAEFMDDIMRFFTEEWIERVAILKRPETIPEEGENYMGNDLARMGGDSFTAEIGNKRNGVVRHIEHFSRKMLLTTDNEEIILDYVKKYNIVKFGIDAGSGTLGVSILDHLLKKPETKRKIEAMNNRKISTDREGSTQTLFQEDMYDNLRSMGETGKLLLLDDPEVRLSLRSVQVELRKDSHGLTKVKISGNDTHVAEGLIRMAELANQKSLNVHIHWM